MSGRALGPFRSDRAAEPGLRDPSGISAAWMVRMPISQDMKQERTKGEGPFSFPLNARDEPTGFCFLASANQMCFVMLFMRPGPNASKLVMVGPNAFGTEFWLEHPCRDVPAFRLTLKLNEKEMGLLVPFGQLRSVACVCKGLHLLHGRFTADCD